MTLAGRQGGFCVADFFNELDDCYTDTERAFLSDYFGIVRPDSLKDLDIYEPVREIYARRSKDFPEYDIPNAVARLALQRVQDYLPARGETESKGDFIIASDYTWNDVFLVSYQPQYLFTIDWADSLPGQRCPEAYYLVWLPVFERYVVTASRATDECYGFEDVAIGWHSFEENRVSLVRKIIQASWRLFQKPNLKKGWAYLIGTGLVSDAEALSWRDEIWYPESFDNDNVGV